MPSHEEIFEGPSGLGNGGSFDDAGGSGKLRATLKAWRERLLSPTARLRWVLFAFILAFGFIWYRALCVQVLDGPDYARRAQRQHFTTEVVSGRRGMLLDRNGQVLAQSVETHSVALRPGLIADPLRTANELGPILGIQPQDLYNTITQTNRRYIPLSKRVDDYTASLIRKKDLPGVELGKMYERVYPFKHMAGQLLGFVGNDGKGLSGIERTLDSRLAGTSTRQVVQRDARGRRFYSKESEGEDPSGEDIRLTIDMQLQFFAEEELAKAVRQAEARWGGAIMVHVPTGEILAWAQYPFFNPNTFNQSSPEVARNRLAQDALEPGSTFKPFVMAAAMQEHKVNRNTVINCEGGRWKTKYVTIRDTHSLGEISAARVLRYSSNIGMAKIGLGLGVPTFYRYIHGLGFGERTSLPIVENRGILRSPRSWNEVDTMSISFGQAISVTGLQMTQAYLTFLSGGITKPLRLILNDEPPTGPRERVYSEAVTREVCRMLREVVEEKDGTGTRARVDGVSVGGKTGTAQKANRRRGANGYGSERLASFVGFLPVENPVYLILVMVDEPKNGIYGGIISAPVFREIAKRTIAYTGLTPGQTTPGQELARKSRETPGEPSTKRRERRTRGLVMAGLSSPFEAEARRNQSTRAMDLLSRTPDMAGEMRLPGHLARASAAVPDVRGKTLRNAVELFARAGIVPEIKGAGGRVVRQQPAPGVPWPEDEAGRAGCVLWLK